MVKTFSALALAASMASAEVYFQDDFTSYNWVPSTFKPAHERAEFTHTPGDVFVDDADKAIQTKTDARFYAASTKLDKVFNNKDKDLFLSYLVKFEQDIDCGGAYVKLLPANTDLETFSGDSPYSIMFGPDVCGTTRKTHLIFNYQRPNEDEAKNLEHKTDIKAEKDKDAHLYTLELTKDNKYNVKIDGVDIMSGSLAENWAFQPAKEIQDPSKSKPASWVDAAKIPDPADKKPAGWDDIPKTIPDPSAKKPEDWDDEDDGDWEPAMIENPAYKGEWKPKMIDNPEYKGEWVHPVIANPDWFEDDHMYNVCKDCGAIGFELWQVKSGTLFDDILVTDSKSELEAHETKVLAKIQQLNDHRKEAEEAERKLKEEAEKKDDESKTEDAADEDETPEKDEL
ncbi:calreticulin [Saprolegnia diclina VS20]|uniref:Calreticulin n=1 Tax=Saprolegnia diclina (strain VS20) TaxID=1156394 RepID=T0Q206_SAPDV|nr:calreticulin [Saprolegnia diclina VS20]EQC28576.1 calreticulin [Saprolegnia diclina VS20]|eukprot:XP_008617973.1 calreticulin [Saprolegnia diclina VS20]